MNDIPSKARNTTYDADFQAGVARTPQPKGSQATSGYKPTPSENTVTPIQKGQTDIHFERDASGRPSIPLSENTAFRPKDM